MLTRLEADGFKNLLGFHVDFGPFNCIAGPNGVGKSNVFDAVRFLSLLTDHTLDGAALAVRGAENEAGDPRDLFWTDGAERSSELRLAAEMLIEPEVTDDFGRAARASSTFLRYELALGWGERHGLELRSESLGYVTEGAAARRLAFPHSAADFRRAAVVNRRRRKIGYVSTRRGADGGAEVLVHQDSGGGGTLAAPAAAARRTVVGSSGTAVTPTVLAARREMAQWRLLALEPRALRRPDRFHAAPRISSRGRHMPATLERLLAAARRAGGSPERLCARIARRLAELTPVAGLGVAADPEGRLLTLEVTEESGATLPARSLSDGTLRFLALAILSEDPDVRGVLCLEEPENGVHPGRVQAWVRLLRELAVAPTRPPGPENPLRQMIVATHSPAFVQRVDAGDLLLATRETLRGGPATALRCRPLAGTWRARRDGRGMSPGSALAYLTTPPGEQIQLPAFQRGSSRPAGNGRQETD